MTRLQGDQFLEVLDGLSISIVPTPNDQPLLYLAQLARRHQLTSYDAAYLDLAQSLGASLLTFDRNLILAANRMHVPIVSADFPNE